MKDNEREIGGRIGEKWRRGGRRGCAPQARPSPDQCAASVGARAEKTASAESEESEENVGAGKGCRCRCRCRWFKCTPTTKVHS